MPGDLVRVVELKRGARLARGVAGEVVEASDDRVEPRCAHFGRCGGCRWQHLAYPAQLEAKRQHLIDALERIGKLTLPEVPQIVASPDAYGYRARARLVETPRGLGYRKKGAHEIEAVGECPILVPAAEAALRAWKPEGATSKDPPTDDRPGRRRQNRRGSGKRPRAKEWEICASALAEAPASVHCVGEPVGERRIEFEVLGETLRARPGSFIQGNALLWESLARKVRDLVQSASGRDGSASAKDDASLNSAPRFIELFAGIGFLTLPMARAGLSGVAFESSKAAVADLEENLRSSNLADRVEAVAGRVESRRDWAARFRDADVLVMDPPRVGLAEPMRKAIAEHGPLRCVYVSCDPGTLARDLRELVAAGYRLDHVEAFDLFPQTPHVEAVVSLSRTKR